MKTITPFVALGLLANVALVSAEETPAIEKIMAEREAVLAKMLQVAEQSTKSAYDLRALRVELYTFRRDAAKTPEDRLSWQKQIVDVEKACVGVCEKRVAGGVITSLDQLRAKERALAAEQKLLEMEAQLKK